MRPQLLAEPWLRDDQTTPAEAPLGTWGAVPAGSPGGRPSRNLATCVNRTRRALFRCCNTVWREHLRFRITFPRLLYSVLCTVESGGKCLDVSRVTGRELTAKSVVNRAEGTAKKAENGWRKPQGTQSERQLGQKTSGANSSRNKPPAKTLEKRSRLQPTISKVARVDPERRTTGIRKAEDHHGVWASNPARPRIRFTDLGVKLLPFNSSGRLKKKRRTNM